jgi:hypothetical protein
MTSQNGGSAKSARTAIKELLRGRTQIAEKLAAQLDRCDQAKAAVTAAQAKADEEAANARIIYLEALDAGWTAAELTGAGLKPPAPPRRRGANADTATAVGQ